MSHFQIARLFDLTTDILETNGEHVFRIRTAERLEKVARRPDREER